MASHPLQDFIRRLRRACSVAEGGHLPDTQLLERFVQQRDEAAFEVLVWRHGTLVLKVARRLLGQAADVEDVFQATFLTLARKASAIRRGTSLGSWLYKVAYRLALRARRAAARREGQQHCGLENVAAPAEQGDAELAAMLAEEVNRLPERCRAVVVLCYLQGATTEEAARVLGCPRGTVLSRLASARQRLRRRLVRRGIAPAAALTAVSFGEAVSASPSVALVAGVVGASLPFAAGGAAVPMVSSQAAALAQGALQTMMWTKIKIVTVVVCMIAVVGTGSGWLARRRSAVEASLPAAEPPVKKVKPLPQAAPDPAEKTEKHIATIQKDMAVLAQRERLAEGHFGKAVIEARLRLLELQDKLKWQEEEQQLVRERLRVERKEIWSEIRRLENLIGDFARKDPGGSVQISNLKARMEFLEKRLMELQQKGRADFEDFRDLRKRAMMSVMVAEEKVRLLEAQQARKREDFAAQRERLQARLQRLEEKKLGLEPADHLRDVERKLDALRREVGKLRRAWERQRHDLREKPE